MSTLPDQQARRKFGHVLWRLQTGQTLSRDVTNLRRGLYELHLTEEGNEYRLYFGREREGGELVILGLKFHMKGGQGNQDRAMEVARERLADWRRRT